MAGIGFPDRPPLITTLCTAAFLIKQGWCLDDLLVSSWKPMTKMIHFRVACFHIICNKLDQGRLKEFLPLGVINLRHLQPLIV